MSNRFIKFEKTNLYKEFGAVLGVETELLTWVEYDFYEGTLTYIRDLFGCSTTPTHQQIETYITNNEHIENADINDFTILIEKLFSTYKSIYKITKKLHNIHIIKERTLKERNEKSLQVKMLKDERNRQIQEFNKALVTCECGLQFIRCYRKHHIVSLEHRHRLDGIRWVLSNINNHIGLDVDSLSSVITDDISDISVSSVDDIENA